MTEPPEKIGYILDEQENETDDWRCLCGNTPDDSGFEPVNRHGKRCEPTTDWNTTAYICNRCERLIDHQTLEVLTIYQARVRYKRAARRSYADMRAARKSKGLTLIEMARELGASYDTVKSWEQGRRAPCCLYMREAIRRLLGVQVLPAWKAHERDLGIEIDASDLPPEPEIPEPLT
jgi:DNA-binding XRE family transcriptional regulator